VTLPGTSGRLTLVPIPTLQNRLDDFRIAGAAADVAGDGEAHLFLARARVLVQQRLGHHDHARGAEAALGGAVPDEALLQRVLKSLDGLHFTPVGLHAQHQARIDRLAVDNHGARAAVADVAAFLRAGEPGLVAQHVEQAAVGLDRQLAHLAVDFQLQMHRCRARRVRTSTIARR
jgi:hypothetical protein